MVRHGQYNLEGKVDEERYLTDLGRKQAELTGQRLALLYKDYAVSKVSSVLRIRNKQCSESVISSVPDP
jgi:serine/threonine-protein phosphatase PGAM5